MLATILFILKIIGLILLGILGILLSLILLILLVPVRYRAEGSYHGSLQFSAAVSWLLHILSFRVTYEKELDICIRIFGIRLGRKERKEEKTDEQPEQRQHSPERTLSPSEPEMPRKTNDSYETELPKEREISEVPPTKSGEKQRKKNGRKIEDLWHSFLQKICKRWESVQQTKEKWMDFLNREENKNTFRLLFRQLKKLLRHILPRKMTGKLRFGLDEPYKTGQILTYVSPFYGLYAKHLQLMPVFDEAVLEGDLKIAGRIRIGTILVLAVRVLLDKNFRKLIGKLRNA